MSHQLLMISAFALWGITLAPCASGSETTSNATLTLGDAVVDSQGRVSIDAVLTSGDRPISALQFEVQYQNQTVALSQSLGNAASAAGKALWTSDPQVDARRIIIAGSNSTPIGDGVVATLSVQITARTLPGRYPLTAANAMAADDSGFFAPISAGNGGAIVPGPVIMAVANAASYTGAAVAPGEIVVLWGNSLAAPLATTSRPGSSGIVASSLGGTSVLFDGIAAPLLYTTRSQVGAIVPYAVDGRSQTSVRVEYQGIRSAPFMVAVTKSSPGVFTLDGSGQGQGAILNQDGSVNGPDNPAPRGSMISVYGTGEGQTVPGGTDGKIVDAPDLRQPLLPVTASIGEASAEVVYAGSAGGQVSGLLQVNLRVPGSVAPGAVVPVKITIGATSQAGVTMAVK